MTSKIQINYSGETIEVTAHQEGDKTYYTLVVSGEEIELFKTPVIDGMPATWAEGKGDKTERADDLGTLIESSNK